MNTTFNRRTFITSAIALGAVCSLNPTQAFATTAAQKQAEVRTVKSQLEAIAAEASAAGDRYHQVMDEYEDASARVEEAQRTIDECSEKIVTLQERLDTRATAMYRSGSTSYLDVLLGVQSFSDFATVWDTLNALNEEDADLAASTKITKATLEAAQGELVAQKERAAAQLAAAESQMQQVLTRQSEYDRIYEGLSEEYRQILVEQEAQEAQESASQPQEFVPTPVTSTQSSGSSSGGSSSGASSSSSSSSSNSGGSSSSSSRSSSTTTVKENKPSSTSSPSLPTNEGVVSYAYSKVGCPYVWGAKGPNSFDCSGFVAWCYRQIGISLPSYTESLYAVAKARFAPSEARPGDVLYKPGHVGISTGGISCVEAMGSRWGVVESHRGGWTAALRF